MSFVLAAMGVIASAAAGWALGTAGAIAEIDRAYHRGFQAGRAYRENP